MDLPRAARLHADPASYGLAFEEIWLTVPGAGETRPSECTAGGFPGPDASAPTLLYLHGARWSLSTTSFASSGFSAWGSRCSRSTTAASAGATASCRRRRSAYADAQAAWQHLRLLEPDRNRRFVYGHSLGGAVAIDLATRNDDVAGLIVESTFTSMSDMAEAMGYGNLPIAIVLTQRFDSLAKVGKLASPVLFIHGTSDRFVPPR